MNSFGLSDINIDMSDLLRSPERCSVSEAAGQGLAFNDNDYFSIEHAPYMQRPMDLTASRKFNEVCFVGPARSGKTMGLILGRLVYTITKHPMDIMLVHSAKDLARDLSNREIKRLQQNSDLIKSAMTGNAGDDNTFDKTYRSGIIFNLAWPSGPQLASRSIPVMLLTDYDRWPGDVGGESNGYQQAKKRTETAGSLGMTVCESSPGSNIADPKYKPPKFELGKPIDHSAPSTISGIRSNIMPIYNTGSREWWYVPCESCGEFYPQNASIDRFSWDSSGDEMLAAETAGTVCCWCGAIHLEETKRTENANGVWLSEGQTIDCYGKVRGKGRSKGVYPSFWLGGGAAAMQTRGAIIAKYLAALNEYKDTGDQSSIKFVINADIGAPYQPQNDDVVDGDTYSSRAVETTKLHVPRFVRCLVATVDIQTDRFVVQVQGFGPGLEKVIVDRYNISKSKTRDDDKIAPASYLEDWEVLTRLPGRLYPLESNPDLSMGVSWVGCDSGGSAGVTANAYKFWARYVLPMGLAKTIYLLKGQDNANAKPINKILPGKTSDSRSAQFAHRKMPLYMLGSNYWKDEIYGCLQRQEVGAGYVHFPDWLGDWFYNELTAERRDQLTGKWEPIAKRARNEAFDLMYYAEAIASIKGLDGVDWDNPPLHLADQLSGNSLVVSSAEGGKRAIVQPSPAVKRKKRVSKPRNSGNGWNSNGGSWL